MHYKQEQHNGSRCSACHDVRTCTARVTVWPELHSSRRPRQRTAVGVRTRGDRAQDIPQQTMERAARAAKRRLSVTGTTLWSKSSQTEICLHTTRHRCSISDLRTSSSSNRLRTSHAASSNRQIGDLTAWAVNRPGLQRRAEHPLSFEILELCSRGCLREAAICLRISPVICRFCLA